MKLSGFIGGYIEGTTIISSVILHDGLKHLNEPINQIRAVWLTVEAGVADVLQESLSFRGLHSRANARVVGAQVLVHVVQGVGHGVHRVNHELHFPFLLVLGVHSDALLAWGKKREKRGTWSQTHHYPAEIRASRRHPTPPASILFSTFWFFCRNWSENVAENKMFWSHICI